jgi:predicted SAM-dependent methyltransferase
MIKLNLACGEIRPEGWINTDSSLNANIQRVPILGNLVSKLFKTRKYDIGNLKYMNLNKKWAYQDNTVDVVYSSHLFEHLSLDAAKLYLKEAYRTLKPCGVLRIVVPDMYQICKKYINEYETDSYKSQSTEFVMWAINMHREGQYSNQSLLRKLILEWQGYPHQHKFMYDPKSLTTVVESNHFKDILLLEYGQSAYIQDIKDVEGNKESYLSVYLEAKK